jgi:hypothetical protein
LLPADRLSIVVPTYPQEDWMKLINTDGLAFIGPGSEWFWTAISGVVLAGTFLAILRQLRIARSANAFEQISRIQDQWNQERTIRYTLDVYRHLQSGADFADVPEGASTYLSDYWDGVGALVRAGHIEERLFHQFNGEGCRFWWAVLGPNNVRYRLESGNVSAGEHFEWLADRMATIDRKLGHRTEFGPEIVVRSLDRRIERAEDQLDVAEALRAPARRRAASAG